MNERTGDSAQRADHRSVSGFLLRAARCALLTLLAVACNPRHEAPIGDAARGKQLVAKYGCPACHIIPNVEGPKGMVGPPLEHIASRPLIGGKLENTPQNLAKWLQNPQAIDPNNAMPNLGITPLDARDLTAFLRTLK
jgi:cytochrome c2